MGRVSKRKAAGGQSVVSNHGKRYKAGIYARLSSQQDRKKNESVEVQIELAKKFVEEFNQEKPGERMEVVQCYTDLGKTGSNFEREGFLQLLRDIRCGRINCVIVKDLSRFGRNYVEAGKYIEKIFPFLGIRLIAVADGFDTEKAGNENQYLASEIKNLVNDMYARDFSKKARIHLKRRREEGSYVGGPPPYGYAVDWKGKRRILIPDGNTAAIVLFIYESFVYTESYTAVADQLNQRNINPPAVYRKTKEVYHSSDKKEYKGWDKSAVERILKSHTYLGTLVQGKTSITARDEKSRIYKSEDEWVVTNEAHEPLIDRELYQKAVEIRGRITQKSASHKHPAKGYPIEENIFHSVLHCGVCGRKMTRSSYVKTYADGEKDRLEGYFCLNSGQTKVTVCPVSNRISKAELVYLLRSLIPVGFGNERISGAIRRAEASLRVTEGKVRRFGEEEGRAYMDYHAGRILQKDYVAYKRKLGDRLRNVRELEEGQKKEITLLKLKPGQELTKEMIEAFISNIYVYPGKRIEILFTFRADGMEGVG